MSKLIDLIQAKMFDHNPRHYEPRPILLKADLDSEELRSAPHYIRCKVSVELGMEVTFKAGDHKGFENMRHDVMRHIKHNLYADLAPIVFELERHVLARDMDKIRSSFGALMAEIKS